MRDFAAFAFDNPVLKHWAIFGIPYPAFLTLPAQCATEWSGEAGRKVVLGFSPNTRLSG